MQIPKIISVDDHVVEPPDLWTARVPEAWKPVRITVLRLSGSSRDRWCRTRPPSTMPEDATMIIGSKSESIRLIRPFISAS